MACRAAFASVRTALTPASLCKCAFFLSATRVHKAPYRTCRREIFAAPGPVLKTASQAASRQVVTMASRVDITKAPYEPESTPQMLDLDLTAEWQGGMRAIGVFEDSFKIEGENATLGEELAAMTEGKSEALVDLLTQGDFKGAKGTTATIYVGGPAKFLTLIGLGKGDVLSKPARGPSPFQAAGKALAGACKTYKCKTAALTFVKIPEAAEVGQDKIVQDVTYGVLTGAAEDTRFKSEPPPPEGADAPPPKYALESVAVVGGGDSPAVGRGSALAAGNVFARWLVNAPPNVCNPTYLAGGARTIADKFPECMSLEVLQKAECEEMGMGCYLGVAECSEHPPQFIHLTYKPEGEVKKKVAVVGKGLTFDSGGYNLKVGGMIELMKFDMGGAAATFGAARALAELRPAGVEVHFISASCENMIDGKGLRPGDVLTSAAGKTVEIGNTDAEGRLTLCDALWFAQEKVGAEVCVDIATLTGAQIVALGTSIGAVMAPESAAAERIKAAGGGIGERWWELPLEDEYFEAMSSKCADFNNIGGRFAGTITAGLFLKQFVDGEKMEWAHCDMAGPGWDFSGKVATGFGATTLASWVEAVAAEANV